MPSGAKCLRHNTYRVFLVGLCLISAACGPSLPVTLPTPTTTLAPTVIEPTAPLLPSLTPSPTSLPPRLILYAPEGSDSGLVTSIQSYLQDKALQAGLRFESRPDLNSQDLTESVEAVIALPPAADIENLAKSNPDVKFLAIDIAGIKPASNLTVIGAEGERPDWQGFMAGAIAAIVTPDWRVGVIAASDTEAGVTARKAFINGATYFCGLCRPSVPPFNQYPIYVELPSSSTPGEWQEASQYLINQQVQTVFIAPGIDNTAVMEALSQAGVNMIGSKLSSTDFQQHWIVSLTMDAYAVFQQVWPDFQQGKTGKLYPVPLKMADINGKLFSIGRQGRAQAILDDLNSGYIGTGINPP